MIMVELKFQDENTLNIIQWLRENVGPETAKDQLGFYGKGWMLHHTTKPTHTGKRYRVVTRIILDNPKDEVIFRLRWA
jgi:hypothetical protein